ncbi:MAG: two-component regulator propeller domain-containing protein [Calditrichia bacterium]
MYARKKRIPTTRIVLLTVLCILLTQEARTQSRDFKLLANREGLSSTLTRSILQDRDGYIWIGTMSGLNRYDGYSVTVYKNIPGDSLSLSNNHVRRLYQSSDGTMWIGTGNGLNRLKIATNPQTGSQREVFERIRLGKNKSESTGEDDIWSIVEDKDGTIWVGTSTSIRFLTADKRDIHPDFGYFKPINPQWQDGKAIRISALTVDKHGNLWIGTIGKGFFCKPAGSDSLVVFQQDKSDPNSLSSNYVVMLKEDSQGILWIGTYRGGLNRYNPATKTFKHYKYSPNDPTTISGNKVYDIIEHKNGYWIATLGDGINFFNPQTETFTRYQNIATNPTSLADNLNRSLMIDRSENLWVLSNRGVNYLDLKPQKFNHVKLNPYDKNSISHNYVSSVFGDKNGDVWIGNNRGIDRWDKNGRFTFYEVKHNNPKSQDGYVNDIERTINDELFLSTFGGGLFQFDEKAQKFKRLQRKYREPDVQPDSRIQSMLGDSRGTLWLGLGNGLERRLPDGRFTHLLWDAEDAPKIETIVGHIAEDSFGYIWIGTIEGLYKLDRKNKNLHQFTHDPLKQSSISNNAINFIYESDNTLWIATSNGLSILDLAASENDAAFKNFYVRDGLPDNYISAIQKDSAGKIWIATDDGICCYNPKTQTFRNYNFNDGLQTVNFVQGSADKLESGELVFGSQNGLIRFNPEVVIDNPYPPHAVFTAFKRVGRTELTGLALNNTSEIRLAYDDRLISFEFAALDFTNSKVNHYAYKMVGYDEDWIENGNDRTATYRNLPAGDYEFLVKGSNNDGIWSTTPSSIRILVTPPYWETWWFRILGFLLLAGLLGMLYRYRVMKLLELERMRVRIASDLHDDVGATLTKISLYSDLIRSGTDPEERNQLLDLIGSKSRELVVTMSDIVWSIDARNDTMEDLLDRMRDYATSLFSATNIDYRFDVSDVPMQRKLPLNTRQNLYLIFKEAVTNTAKHSDASSVRISLSERAGKLLMAIHDNGIGVQENVRRSGHGMQNMKMRAKRIRGELEVESNSGLTITLRVNLI